MYKLAEHAALTQGIAVDSGVVMMLCAGIPVSMVEAVQLPDVDRVRG